MSKLDIQYKKGVYSYLVNWLFLCVIASIFSTLNNVNNYKAICHLTSFAYSIQLMDIVYF